MNFKTIILALATLTQSTFCMEQRPQLPQGVAAMNSLQGLPPELKGYLLPFIASDDTEKNLVTAATISKSFYKAVNDEGHILAITDSILAQKQYALQAINLVKKLQKKRTVTLPVMRSEKVQQWMAATQARLQDGEKLLKAIYVFDLASQGECFKNKYINLNWQNAYGNSVLGAAIRDGNPLLAKRLLDAGANPNIRNDIWTMLALAANFDRVEITRYLIAAGADPNALDGNGRTTLVTAIRNFRISIIDLLVEAGADPDLKDIGPNAISAREAAMFEDGSIRSRYCYSRYSATEILNDVIRKRKERMQEALQSRKK